MISGLWVSLKALLANEIRNMLLKPRGSSRCCLCTSLPVPIGENFQSERVRACPPASHILPACCWGKWALLVPATTSCPPVALVVPEEPRLVLSFAPDVL